MNNQIQTSMDALIKAQNVLGELGYTMNSSFTFYKDYGLVNGGTCRIQPLFDKGIMSDKDYKLIGFEIVSQKIVSIVEGQPIPLHEFPYEAVGDISTIIVELMPAGSITNTKATHIITSDCMKCSIKTESFVHVRGKSICFPCMMKFSNAELPTI